MTISAYAAFVLLTEVIIIIAVHNLQWHMCVFRRKFVYKDEQIDDS